MNVHPLHQQPTTNDEELARVLANAQDDSTPHDASAPASGLQFEETPATDSAVPQAQATEEPVVAPTVGIASSITAEEPVATSDDSAAPVESAPSTTATPPIGLDSLKKTALEELRPLVSQLELPAEEKFDTLLLIIRSTDDQSLLEPAHEAAKLIADDHKRAQALLDIVREIDYFSHPGSQAAA